MVLRIFYGIQSGSGFFVKWENDSPMMDSDPVYAARMNWQESQTVMEKLEKMGLAAERFQINHMALK
jgi:hypothetical protein